MEVSLKKQKYDYNDILQNKIFKIVGEVEKELDKLDETIFKLFEKRKIITEQEESFENMAEKIWGKQNLLENCVTSFLNNQSQNKQQTFGVPSTFLSTFPSAVPIFEYTDNVTKRTTRYFAETPFSGNVQQNNTFDSFIPKETSQEKTFNSIPVCEKCESVFMFGSKIIYQWAWECCCCKTFNKAPFGHVFTYFKDYFPITISKADCRLPKEVITSKSSEPSKSNEIYSKMQTISYRDRFEYVEDYVMMRGYVCVWVVGFDRKGTWIRGHYRKSIKLCYKDINYP